MKRLQKGFTVIELLTVIVIISLLAALTYVSYNGIRQRANDAKRRHDFSNLQKALEQYRGDQGHYPNCSGGVYVPGGAVTCGVSSLAAALVPAYINSLPSDPINSTATGGYVYMYGVGYRKDPYSCNFLSLYTDNYILGVKLELDNTPPCAGWWGRNDLNYIIGSNNP